MKALQQLEAIVKETYNTEFRLSFDGREWKIYIVKSKTIFRGSFEEVIELAAEEFLSYRKPSTQHKHIKHYKPYTYQ